MLAEERRGRQGWGYHLISNEAVSEAAIRVHSLPESKLNLAEEITFFDTFKPVWESDSILARGKKKWIKDTVYYV